MNAPSEAGWSSTLLALAAGCLCLAVLFGVAPIRDRFVLGGGCAALAVVFAGLAAAARRRVPAGVGPVERSGH